MSSNVLSLTDVTKAYGADPVLDGVSVGVDAGERVGIIGANGAGKSTLLRIIAGREEPDSGTVAARRGLRIAFSEQTPVLPPQMTVAELLEEGLRELTDLIAAYEAAAETAAGDLPALLDRIEHLGGWDYQHRIRQASMALGLPDLTARVEQLSGGERKRATLAALTLQQPDVLLLDEPTNHLDAETVEWLERWLTSSSMTVLLVTHDRYFLDDVVGRLVELRDGTLRSYEGTYTDYVATRAVEEARREKLHHRRLQGLMTELAWARRSPRARTTKSQARLERIEAAQEEVASLAGRPAAASMVFGQAPRLGSTILELDRVQMGFGDQPPLIADLTLKMRAGQRIGILGTNGSGKSTLLKLVTGDLAPTRGSVTLGLNTQIAYFDQQRSAIDPQQTVRQALTPQGGDIVHPGGGAPLHVASWLDRFGFPSRTHDRPVHTLSGGERNRLSIARFLLQRANLLIFDEPTNDLDIATLQLLEAAIVDFEGCVLIVTHDRYMLDKVASAIVAFEREHLGDGAVTYVEGNYTHYRGTRLRGLAAASAARRKEEASAERLNVKPARLPVEAAAPKKKGLTYAERLEIEQIEPRIEQADAQVAGLQAQFSDPELWKDPARARSVQAQLDAATERAAALYARWEVLLEVASLLEKWQTAGLLRPA